jgi:hypothetical protein
MEIGFRLWALGGKDGPVTAGSGDPAGSFTGQRNSGLPSHNRSPRPVTLFFYFWCNLPQVTVILRNLAGFGQGGWVGPGAKKTSTH